MNKLWVLDCESLGICDNAVILSIGMTYFSIGEECSFQDLIQRGFYVKCDRKEQAEKGLKIEKETVSWWEDQGDEAREVLSNKDTVKFKYWSKDFASYLMDNEFKNDSIIMSRHLIDERWVNNLFLAFKGERIFNYWCFRDTATALDLLTGNPTGFYVDLPGFIKHNALHDVAADGMKLKLAFERQ